MIRFIASFIGPAIFLGAYVMPMFVMAQNVSQYANVVAGKVEARTSPDAMLDSLVSGRMLEEAVERLPFSADQAHAMVELGLAQLDAALQENQSVSPLLTEQLQRYRDLMHTLSGFLRQKKGLSR